MFLKLVRPKFNYVASFDPTAATESETQKVAFEWQWLRQQKQASYTSFPEMPVLHPHLHFSWFSLEKLNAVVPSRFDPYLSTYRSNSVVSIPCKWRQNSRLKY